MSIVTKFGMTNNVYCSDRIKEPERMISARISLEEGVEKGINALINEREKHCKILIGVDDDP